MEMKSQRNIARLMLLLGVGVLFSLSAMNVILKADLDLQKWHQGERGAEGVGEDEIKAMESFEEEENKGDHPYEAQAFRRKQMQDEKGSVPVDGMEKARQQVKSMKVSAKADPKQTAGVKPDSWTWMGPGNISGRIRSIVIHPINPAAMWVGSVGGGIWQTLNGGASWSPVNDFLANLAVSTMIISPTNSSTMYAGTG